MLKYLFATLTIMLASCEGMVKVSGNIVDASTSKPLSGAKVELMKLPVDSFATSRDSGHFQIGSRMIGMVKKPVYNLRISKDGYRTIEIPFGKGKGSDYQLNGKLLIPSTKQ